MCGAGGGLVSARRVHTVILLLLVVVVEVEVVAVSVLLLLSHLQLTDLPMVADPDRGQTRKKMLIGRENVKNGITYVVRTTVCMIGMYYIYVRFTIILINCQYFIFWATSKE